MTQLTPEDLVDSQIRRTERQFTDREEFFQIFYDSINNLGSKDHCVLAFYGVGGIGKTSLQKELRKAIEKMSNPIIWTALDFSTPAFRNMENVLFELRNSFRRKYKIHFPYFDLAYAVYWQKTHPQIPLNQTNFPLMEEGTIVANIISTIGGLPLINIIPETLKVAAKLHGQLKDWWLEKGEETLRRLDEMEPWEIEAKLPEYLSRDFSSYIQKNSSQAVIFIDTYEELWGVERTEGKFFSRDSWLRTLVAYLPGVLWVISGREKLRWAELKDDWEKVLSQHLIGELADTDAVKFLESCGIKDNKTQQVIVEACRGVPFYLDLAVDSYQEIKKSKNREPIPEDYGKTPKELLIRFIRHLNEHETETLKVLSVPRFWDSKLFKLLLKEYQTGYPLTGLSSLCRFSFIHEGEEPNTWYMHQLMRDSLQDHQDPAFIKNVHLYLFNNYRDQLKDLDIKNITDVQKKAFQEAFYHGHKALSIEEWFHWFIETAEEFDQAAQWQFLTSLYQDMTDVLENHLGPDHPHTATSLNNLAGVYKAQGNYAEAEQLSRRALEICEKALGPHHPDTATSLDNLAGVYQAQGNYAKAEPLFRRAVEISERALGTDHPDTAASLNNLALVYQAQGNYAKAEPLFRRAVEISERALGTDHPDTATSLNNLARVFKAQGNYANAEPLYRRAWAIYEKALGPDHPQTAISLNNLAGVYKDQGNYAKAEPLYRQALAICEKALGPDHPHTAMSLNNLAGVYYAQGNYAKAESLYRRAWAIREKALGPDHPDTAMSLNNLAGVYHAQGNYAKAEQLFRRTLEIREKSLGPHHPDTAMSLNNLAGVYHAQGNYAEAEPLFRRAVKIWGKALGPDHPDTAASLNNLAGVYEAQGNYAKAEQLYRQALEIREKALGSDHPHTAASLNNLAGVYKAQGNYAEAKQLFRRALEICEKALGSDHPHTAASLNNLAGVYEAQRNYAEAKQLYRQALEICEKAFGKEHPITLQILENYNRLKYGLLNRTLFQ